MQNLTWTASWLMPNACIHWTGKRCLLHVSWPFVIFPLSAEDGCLSHESKRGRSNDEALMNIMKECQLNKTIQIKVRQQRCQWHIFINIKLVISNLWSEFFIFNLFQINCNILVCSPNTCLNAFHTNLQESRFQSANFY